MPGTTVVEEIASLRALGYDVDFSVAPSGRLHCEPCGHDVIASDAIIETTARFEGPSNPDDQAIVFGLRCHVCGLRGVLVTAYGPTATAEEAAVLVALLPPTRP